MRRAVIFRACPEWLEAKGSLPLSLALTYRAMSSRSGIWGRGFFSPLIAHLEIGDEMIAMVKDSGHVTGYLILGSGPDQEFVPQWDKYNTLELDGDGNYLETRRASLPTHPHIQSSTPPLAS